VRLRNRSKTRDLKRTEDCIQIH